MSTLKGIVIVGLLGYGGLIALMYLFQRTMMYFPDTRFIAPAEAGFPRAEGISFASGDGETLRGWLVAPQPGKPVVLYFQGNGGGLDLRVRRFGWLTADGTGLLALSYRGYGGSTGSPTEAGLIRDALAAYDVARTRFPQHRIVLFGESLGSGVAVALAAERDVAGVILDAPFTSAADVGAAAYPFAPVRWLIKDSFRSDLRIGRVKAPLLIVHGTDDRVVPIRFGERLFALANEPKRMARLSGGNHSDLDDHGAPAAVAAFLAGL